MQPIEPRNSEAPRLLPVAEVATMLAVSKARAYELTRTGLLPSVRLGRQVRVSMADLQGFIERGGSRLLATKTTDQQNEALVAANDERRNREEARPHEEQSK
jgi:excisionase family DNA binding protein